MSIGDLVHGIAAPTVTPAAPYADAAVCRRGDTLAKASGEDQMGLSCRARCNFEMQRESLGFPYLHFAFCILNTRRWRVRSRCMPIGRALEENIPKKDRDRFENMRRAAAPTRHAST